MTQLSVAAFLLIYFGIINAIGFLIMGIDKLKARKRAFRIPEATLFLVAFMGGSVGSILGMYIFRHKTRHRRFTVGMSVILILQIAVFAFLFFGPWDNHTL